MWKNKFHISPPYGLLNDPNGLIYWNNEYHVFYQWNPNACKHGSKSWAHLKSTDLINWEPMPIALSPTDWFDKNGCYSGSAIEKNGELYIFYTGNVKNNGIRKSYQCLATSKDGITFEKKGPVIYDQDIPKGYTKHFRDPKVFIQNGIYKMVLGAQRNDLTGTIVIFSSKDLIHWKFEGEIIQENFGFMCECPDFIEDNNKKALIFSPQGIESKGYLYNNRYQSGYIIRDLFEVQKNKFIELDRGFEFYAPQTFKDEYNKNALIGWIGMPEELNHPSVKSENWIHSLTLPRTLEIKENKILQNPHINLKKLRKNAIILENINFQNILNLSDYNIFGETYELIVNFENFSGNIDINLRKNEEQKTTFSYDSIEKKATLDRSLSGFGYKGVRSCYLENLEKIHIFVDRSTVEIFLNNGAEVFTGNIYPNNDSLGIEFKINTSLCVSKLEFYNL